MARRRGRRRGANPALGALASPMKAVTRGFDLKTMQTAGFIVLGNLGTVMLNDKLLAKAIAPVGTAGWFKVAGTLGMAGVAGMLAGMVLGKERAAQVGLGGVLAGVTRGLQALAPGTFGAMSGMDEDFDLEGWDDDGLGDFVRPYQIQRAMPMLGDYATLSQGQKAFRLLDGMSADDVVAEEIMSQA